MKKYRKIILYVGLSLGVVVAALSLSVFLFRDRIINEFIREANKRINTPIKVRQIDLSLFRHFPRLSIVMRDVYVEDSQPGDYPLLTAGVISFEVDPFDAWAGNYNIEGLEVTDCEASFRVDENGRNNYTILKDGGTTGGSSVVLELRDVRLNKVNFSYLDVSGRRHLVFTSNGLDASILAVGDRYEISAAGDITSDKIEVEGTELLTGKVFDVDASVEYLDGERRVQIRESLLRLSKAAFTVSGHYQWKDANEIDLKVSGKDTDVQTILSLMPERVTRAFERYESRGEVYFNADLRGTIAKNRWPALHLDFGCRDATIFHPEYRSRIEEAVLSGSFHSTDLADRRRGVLELKNVKGLLNDKPFSGEFLLRDFSNPAVTCSFKGVVDAAAIPGFFPLEGVSDVSGSLLADISFDGRVDLLKDRSTAQRVSTQGTIELDKISLTYGKAGVPLKDLHGSLQFSNNDLAMSNVTGRYGNSDFVLNGFFKNVITFLLFENQPIGIEADLKSSYLDLNQLFEQGFGAGVSGGAGEYQFNISENVYLNFNCDVRRLKYDRFNGQAIRGDLLVKNKVAVSRGLELQTMGGKLVLRGIVDSTNPRAIDVVCSGTMDNIHIDSVFYVFKNFGQQFIEDRHLKGRVRADVDLEMTLNPNLRIFPETLIADIGATIREGQLNNFEPLRKLNRYLDDDGLARMRFSELRNDIHIENKTVYIPQMDVRSNVTDISVSGTHTFDQRIDYRLVTPLRGKRKVPVEEASGAIESDAQGQSRLFLKITGTTSDYRIAYDTEAVKKKIISDLKQEVRDLKDAFRKKEAQKQKEIEVQEDEYFEWSE